MIMMLYLECLKAACLQRGNIDLDYIVKLRKDVKTKLHMHGLKLHSQILST